MSPRRPHLLLCMTPGIGLGRWNAVGCLERELKPYVEYVERGWDVTIATYDRPSNIPQLPPGLQVTCCPPARLLPLAPWFLRRVMRRCDVVKTNQSGGAWWYLGAARFHRKPLLLRCGWLPGSYLETKEGLTPRLRRHRRLEGWAFRHADACMVATAADRDWAVQHYRVPVGRVHLRPNFVDTARFRPEPGMTPRPRSVVFVGRLETVKNPALLIEACATAGASELALVGEGPERTKLQALAAQMNLPVILPGAIPQADLASFLRAFEVFVLPSKVEGHPKALFEAMATGLPCVGTRVPGIENALREGDTGLLCTPSALAIAQAIGRLFDDAPLRRRLGAAGCRWVEQTLSFQTVMEAEIRVARRLLPGAGASFDSQPQPVSQAA